MSSAESNYFQPHKADITANPNHLTVSENTDCSKSARSLVWCKNYRIEKSIMCEISKSQRRTFRDQDPPRIQEQNLLKDVFEVSRSTPNSPTTLQRESIEKCFSDPEFFRKQRQLQMQREKESNDSVENTAVSGGCDRGSTSSSRENNACTEPETENGEDWCKIKEAITNGDSEKDESDNYDNLINGREMAPVLGVPLPPPTPHMGPDGLILPKKPYNPCLTSGSHKDLHRELLFNQKVGRNVLNQKSELQRALERHREAVSRKEAERNKDEFFKDDPRTNLQRAIEQRAKHIQLMQEQVQHVEPPNPLVTARAKLRSRMDSQ